MPTPVPVPSRRQISNTKVPIPQTKTLQAFLVTMDPSAQFSDCQTNGYCMQNTENNGAHVEHNVAALNHSLLERNRCGWRKVVINFTPSWFSITMGTGIVAILLHNLPYNGMWLYWVSVIIFAMNVVLFTSFAIISLLRYTLFPGLWACMIRHPVQSLFLGEQQFK